MAGPIATAAVQIVPSFKGLHKATKSALRGTEGDFREQGRRSGGLLTAGFKGLAISGVVAAGGAIASGFGIALAKGFGRLTAIENAQKKLEGLGHDAKTVEQIMNNSLNSVKGTAFGLDEAATVAAGLVASGIKPGQELEKTLKTVADSATIAGIGMDEMGAIFGKVAATGKLQGDELNQLSERGIPALQLLSDHLGVTTDEVRKMVSKGEVDFATFAAAMEAGMGGAALKSGETFQGAWKNTMAALGRIGARILEPIFNAARDGMNALMPVLDQLGEAIGPLADAFGALLAKAMPVVTAVFIGMANAIIGTIGWLGQHIGLLKTLGTIIGVVAAAYLLWNAGLAIHNALSWVSYLWASREVLLNSIRIAVTNGLAAAQAGLNAALAANPIGLVIIAIAALIAIFVLAYKKVGWFRDMVDAAWAGIKTAVGAVVDWFQTTVWPVLKQVWDGIAAGALWLWNNAIKPAWDGIKTAVAAVIGWFQTSVGPALSQATSVIGGIFSWLYENIVKPVFTGMQMYIGIWWAVIKGVFNAVMWVVRNILAPAFQFLATVAAFAWEGIRVAIQLAWGIIKVIFAAVNAFVRTVLAPVFTWLYNFVINPVFSWIGNAIRIWWTGAKIVFNAVVSFLRATLGPVFTWLRDSVITPVWNGIKNAISTAWNFIRDKVFSPLANAIKNTVPDAFRAGRDAISKAWEGIRDVAKKPVRFVVDTIINKGIIGGFNKIAEKFGVDKVDPFKLPKGFRAGGRVLGPGSETSDSIPAMLSHNEHVWTAREVRGAGGHDAVYHLRNLARRGALALHNGAQPFLPALAKGGTLIDAANWWVRKGARGSRHPAFGGAVRSGHSKNSLHYQDRAVDLNYGPGGENAIEKAFFDKHVAEFKRLFPGIRVIWRAKGHFNHMHIDNSKGADIGDFSGAASGGGGVDIGSFLNPFKKLFDKVAKGVGGSPFGKLIGAGAKKMIEAPIQWIKDNAFKVADFVEDTIDTVGNFVGSGVARGQGLAWAGLKGWPLNGARWKALDFIVTKESSWNPRAKNPRSTASGLGQFINANARHYLGSAPMSKHPIDKQLDAIVRYTQDRFGGLVPAMNYWKRHRHYRDGGPVTPTLYDSGGWLPPGLTTVLNATGKPEPVLTPDQWAKLGNDQAGTRIGTKIDVLYAMDMDDALRRLDMHEQKRRALHPEGV
ncbi:tape measure protein [Brevibacterium otitidis]|uniref:Tape measure protein n=1 Tax=Brevibacterium otitidis TaxID=53364 RepID=A0ABV5X2S8_9MICO|nr:hypothetical protein GCM10023233_22620 [Brevibacterium otitidis]